jgi:hypothetical protein
MKLTMLFALTLAPFLAIFAFLWESLLPVWAQPVAPNASPEPSSELSQPEALAGIQFQEASELNTGTIYSVNVTETVTSSSRWDCNGPISVFRPATTSTRSYTENNSTRAWFLSKTTPPAPGLRVLIQNTTPGLDQTAIPYSDREYDQGDRSESFSVRQGDSHRLRYLAVVVGLNSFTYQIKHGETVIESGSFSATIDHQVKAETRASHRSSSNFQRSCMEKERLEERLDELHERMEERERSQHQPPQIRQPRQPRRRQRQ